MTQPTIPPADRIRDLSAINDDIPTLLASASRALSALTGAAPPASDSDDAPTLDASKAAFTAHAQAYFLTLQSVMARLRRHVYALEEAGIVGAEAPILAAGTGGAQGAAAQRGMLGGAGARRGVSGAGPGGGRAAAAAAAQGGAAEDAAERLVNGGLGNLDVAWLNGRVGAGELEKQGEVLGEATRILHEVLGEANGVDQEMLDGE